MLNLAFNRSEDSPVASKTKSRINSKSKGKIEQRLFKALSHPLRFQALIILSERVASPNELAKELNEGLSQVSYHVKVLKDCECIELVKTEPRRGAVEHYYRATSRAFLSDDEWARLPERCDRGSASACCRLRWTTPLPRSRRAPLILATITTSAGRR